MTDNMTDNLVFLHRYCRIEYDDSRVDIIAMKSYIAGTWHLTSKNWEVEEIIIKRSGATLRWTIINNPNIKGDFRSLKLAAAAASKLLRNKL